MTEPSYLTTEQVAERFHVTANAVRGWRRDRKPPYGWVTVGRQRLLPADCLAAYENDIRKQSNTDERA